MSTYAVIRKTDAVEVYRYAADAPIEWVGFEFALFDHVLQTDPVIEQPPATVFEWGAMEFLRRFTPEERIAARVARQSDVVLNDFFSLLELAPSVHSNDPDVIAGMQYLTHIGVISVGRAAEILGGA